VVNDVCAECNSRRLSDLDEYLCRLYDSHLRHLQDFDSVVSFEFDGDLLTRMLLKIAYNSARLGGSDSAPLRAVRKYIIGVEPRPARIATFLEVVSPSLVDDPSMPGGKRKVMPEMYRSAVTGFLANGAESIQTRMIAVNSYYFHLMLPAPELQVEKFEQLAEEFSRRIGGVVRLAPQGGRIELRSSTQDGLRSIVPMLSANREQYESYFARRRSE